jgi:hypothetical protein
VLFVCESVLETAAWGGRQVHVVFFDALRALWETPFEVYARAVLMERLSKHRHFLLSHHEGWSSPAWSAFLSTLRPAAFLLDVPSAAESGEGGRDIPSATSATLPLSHAALHRLLVDLLARRVPCASLSAACLTATVRKNNLNLFQTNICLFFQYFSFDYYFSFGHRGAKARFSSCPLNAERVGLLGCTHPLPALC